MGKRKMDSDLHRIKLETGTVYQTSKGGNYYFRYQVKGERKCVNIHEQPEVRIKYFVPDEHNSGGEIIEFSGKVKKVLPDKRIMVFSTDMHIPIVDIIDICILGHKQ